MKKNWKRKIPMMVIFCVAGMAAFTGVVMLLWNSILPIVLHAGMITFWQAAGLLVLARLLFGGFKGRHHAMAYGCRNRDMHMKWERKNCCAPVAATNE